MTGTLVRRKLLVSAMTLGLLAAPLAGTASADAGYWNDPTGDCCPEHELDITQYSVALNSEVVSTSVTFAAYNRAILQSADLYADLDVNGDGGVDYELHKPAGGETAVLRQGEFGPTISCSVPLRIEAYPPRVEMSTMAACIGRPVSVRVSYYITTSQHGFDVAPGWDLFSPAVSRGYVVMGAIAERWHALGGANGVLGPALTDETDTGNGGRYNFFRSGSIFWTSATGAQAVFGGMREGWARTGAEWGFLRFPTSGEVGTAGRPGAVQLFQGGSLYWSATTGAHPVRGAIMEAWARQGYEGGRLGFPRTGEFDSPDGRKQEFQGGNIVWTPERGAVVAYR